MNPEVLSLIKLAAVFAIIIGLLSMKKPLNLVMSIASVVVVVLYSMPSDLVLPALKSGLIGSNTINALLVLPAAAARNVSGGMRSYHGLSILFSLFSGVSGLILSYYLGTSAGGTTCLVAAALFFLTYAGNRIKARG